MTPFRPATAADADAILAMMAEYYAEDGYPFDAAQARQAVIGLVADERLGRLWVAQHDGRIVGYLAVTYGYSLEYRGRDAFVDEVFIAADARGRGLGTAAIELAESHCRVAGVRALHLEVELHRDLARELYRRVGFAGHDRTLMTKLLD